MEEQNSQGIRVFVSYSHADRKWLDRLMIHLKPLRELCRLEAWDDTRIKPGSKWREEIKVAVDRSSVAILLVSADFLASDFIRTDELPPLLKASEENGATILPIIVSPCLFSKVQHLSQFQAVNDPATPLVNIPCGEQEAVWVRVADAILGIAQSNAPVQSSPPIEDKIIARGEDFLKVQTFTRLLKIGDWIFDQSRACIVGSGMNAFLVSRENYGAEPFTATMVARFTNFAYPKNGKLGMNAGLVFGWNDEKQRPRYYNVVMSGVDIRLERIGFESPPAKHWQHLTDPRPFRIEHGATVQIDLSVQEDKITIVANGERVVECPKPTGVVGRVGLRPWRSQLECTRFVVSNA